MIVNIAKMNAKTPVKNISNVSILRHCLYPSGAKAITLNQAIDNKIVQNTFFIIFSV